MKFDSLKTLGYVHGSVKKSAFYNLVSMLTLHNMERLFMPMFVSTYTTTCESIYGTCTLESLKLLMVPGMNVLANLEHPEPIEEARVPMIPRVVMMWFLLESERRALRAPGSSPRDGSMNLAALMIS